MWRGSLLLLRCDNCRRDLDRHILYVHSRINQSIATDCRTFRPRGPSSTAYSMYLIMLFLYAVDKGLCDQNSLQSVAIDSLILLYMYMLIKVYLPPSTAIRCCRTGLRAVCLYTSHTYVPPPKGLVDVILLSDRHALEPQTALSETADCCTLQ